MPYADAIAEILKRLVSLEEKLAKLYKRLKILEDNHRRLKS